MKKKFPVYNQLNLPQINKEVLNEWDENDLFSKSMTEREGAPSFVFFEGPPSANARNTSCDGAQYKGYILPLQDNEGLSGEA